MVRKRKNVYVTPEQKVRAIKQIRDGRPRKEVADELGVSPHTVNLWMSKLRRQTEGSRHMPIDPRSLQEQIKMLEAEVESLKKRMALYDLRAK
jgi:transposase-like protein